jgi:hypothetical protein
MIGGSVRYNDAETNVHANCHANSSKLHHTTPAKLLAPALQWPIFNHIESVITFSQQFLWFWL